MSAMMWELFRMNESDYYTPINAVNDELLTTFLAVP